MIKTLVFQYKNNTRFKQVISLFFVNLIGIPMGVITSIIITKYLGSKGFGDYRFILSVFNFAVLVFTFGFYQAGNRALVLTNDYQKAKEYYGAELIITGFLFLVMSIFLFVYAFLDPNIEEKQLRNILMCIIPFGWVFLLQRYYEILFQADNQINLLAKSRLYPQVGFLIMAALVFFYFINMDYNRLSVIWIFYLATQVLVYCFIMFRLRISFRNIKIRLNEIWNYNRSFGFNLYLGSLFAVGFAQLSPILISYFGLDNSGVGFYSLALTFAMPLTFIPNTIATTHYKDFSVQKFIPRKLFILTLSLSITALIGLWIVVGPFVHFFYGKEFGSVIQLNFIVSIGLVAHGMADFFNRYMGANGQGKTLRNTSIIVGFSILLGNVLLIPKWGEYGAAFSTILSGFTYLIVMILYYLKFVKETV